MKLIKICAEGFHFQQGCQVWVQPLPTLLTEGAVVTGCDLETFTLSYTLDDEELELSYTQDQIDAARDAI